ncbi:MAG: stage II sporulation protein M [Planctomycetaceae bacterium]
MSGFVKRNRPGWEELDKLVQQVRRSPRSLTPQDLTRLDVLYRRATIHLSQVATRTNDRRLVAYLNDLVGSAHGLIYLPPKQSVLAGLREFLQEGFARVLARHWKAHAVSAGLLLGGALLAYLLSIADPLANYALWPREDIRQPGSSPEQLLEVLRGHRDGSGGEKFAFASSLFVHNLKVGLLAMALGVLAGIPTSLLMIYNGMILGVFVAIHLRAGINAEMWAWILPHGVTEIGAIILCGGIGLILGKAIVSPGMETRTVALRRAGEEAGLTMLGVGGMLCVAAVIESFLRQSHLSTGARLTFAGVSALFWVAFFLHGLIRERAAIAKVPAD